MVTGDTRSGLAIVQTAIACVVFASGLLTVLAIIFNWGLPGTKEGAGAHMDMAASAAVSASTGARFRAWSRRFVRGLLHGDSIDPFAGRKPLPGYEHLGRAILDRQGQPSGSSTNYEATRGSTTEDLDSGPVVIAPAAASLSLTPGTPTITTTHTHRGVRWILSNDLLSGPLCLKCKLPLHRSFSDPNPAAATTRVSRLRKLVCLNCARRYDMEGGLRGIVIQEARRELELVIRGRAKGTYFSTSKRLSGR